MSSASKCIGPLKMNETIISKDNEMVELFSDQFRSVFTVEDQNGLVLLQPRQ